MNMKTSSSIVKRPRPGRADLRRVPVQARSRRTVARLLEAASRRFSEAGFDAATTTEIAAAAKVSVGALYQFFADKGALLDALVEAHASGLDGVLSDAERAGDGASITAIVERIVDEVLAYASANHFFATILVGAGSPPIVRASQQLRSELADRVELVISRKPISRARRRRVAVVCVDLLAGLLPRVLDEPRRGRAAMEGELKLALAAYIEAVSSS